jgi:hypothetical protein
MGFALAEVSIPKGATEIEPGVYKHTDAAGKTFIFRKTPFGVVKSPEQGATQDKAPAPQPSTKSGTTASPFGDVNNKPSGSQDVKVVERGDVLEFERPSPFGSYKWKAKKAELTADERDAWTRARERQTSKSPKGPKE